MPKLAEKNPRATTLSASQQAKSALHNEFKTGLKAVTKPYMFTDLVLDSLMTKKPDGIMDAGHIKLAEGYLRLALVKCKTRLTGIYEDITSMEEGKAIDDTLMGPLLSSEATHQQVRKQIHETVKLMVRIHRMEGNHDKAEETKVWFRENDLSAVPVAKEVERSGILHTLRQHESQRAELAA
jgi:hypothetical protein